MDRYSLDCVLILVYTCHMLHTSKLSPKQRGVVIYTRVSTDEQATSGLGLEAQLAACRKYCELRGHTVMAEFSDPAVSGKDDPETRPGFRALLARIASQGGVVVVYAISRLTRRQSHLWRLLDDSGTIRLELESATEPFDTSSPIGRAMLGMLGVWAQLEADQISARTKAALQARKARGLRLGPPPISETRPEVVDMIGRARYEEGKSFGKIAFELNSMGVGAARGGTWDRKAIQRAALQWKSTKGTPINC